MKVSIARQIISHLVVTFIGFQLGQQTATHRFLLCSDSPSAVQLFIEKESRSRDNFNDNDVTNKATTRARKEHNRFKRDFIRGISWVPRDEFTKIYDLGIPFDGKNEESIVHNVLLIHTTKNSLPHTSYPTNITTEIATENCKEISIVVTDRKHKDHCIAVMENWGANAYINRFSKETNRFERFHFDAKHSDKKLPCRNYTKESDRILLEYLNTYEEALEELRPIATKIAVNNTIIVMTANYGQAVLLHNFVCAATKIKMDLSNILFFATDEETYLLATNVLGLTAYYNEKIFGSMPSKASGNFGSSAFSKMMMAKVYSVQLINELDYDLLFSDVDIVPLRPNILEYFHHEKYQNFDFIFQYDRNFRPSQAPYSANSGFYFCRANKKTNYFFSLFSKMGNVIQSSGSHQQVMTVLLGQHSSIHGLRVKVIGGKGQDSDLFPNGWHFTMNEDYREQFRDGKQKPYIVHMNWNFNLEEKMESMKEWKLWFVNDERRKDCSIATTNHSVQVVVSLTECCVD